VRGAANAPLSLTASAVTDGKLALGQMLKRNSTTSLGRIT
jgi:hypothetical protein